MGARKLSCGLPEPRLGCTSTLTSKAETIELLLKAIEDWPSQEEVYSRT
jgi:hypothetical protein